MADNPRPRTVRTRAANAGQPQTHDTAAADAGARPTDEELDQRDRMKVGPRRPAGPPLAGDHPEPEPLARIPAEAGPDPTDPPGL